MYEFIKTQFTVFFHLTLCLSLSDILDRAWRTVRHGHQVMVGHEFEQHCNLEWRWTSARLGFTKWNEMAPNRKGGGVFYKWYGKNNKLDSSQSGASAHKRKGTHFPCTFWPFWVRKECIQNGIWKDNLKRILNIRSWQLGITNLYCEVILATVFFILRLT